MRRFARSFPHKSLLPLILGLCLALPAKAVTLLTDGGQLVGVTGLVVNEFTYDIRFVDGSCASVFDGCDDHSDIYFFPDADQALATVRAMRDLVFIDSAAGAFDSNPQLTRGCDSLGNFCTTFFPFTTVQSGPITSTFVALYGVINREGARRDDVAFGSGPIIADTPELTFAVFTLTGVTPAVPLPAAGWLYLGLGGAMVALRQRAGRARRKGRPNA